ncbi:MAG: DinB family protein [Planctomycetales bacterium]|nr:DinB family protein [Planctomycetales bacterium]
MFERELAINRLHMMQFETIVADVDDASFFQPGAGHGLSPMWIVGHLAATADYGCQMLRRTGEPTSLIRLFGPGTSGAVDRDCGLERNDVCAALLEGYRGLQQAAAGADDDILSQPQPLPFFKGTPIETTMDLVAYMLTSHCAFHLAQLSSCRRELGFPPLV